MFSHLSVRKPRRAIRERMRFGTRTLMAGFTVVCLAVGWGSLTWYRNYRHDQALTHIAELGGQLVTKDGAIDRVYLANPEIDDEKFAALISHLRYVRGMRELDLVNLPITDRSAELFYGFPELEELYLFETDISEAGTQAIADAMPHVDVKLEQPDPVATRIARTNIYPHAIVALATDRLRVVTGSGDGTLRWWMLPDLERSKVTAAHECWLFAAAFSPGASMLTTAGGDDMIRMWDTSTGLQVGELVGHDDDVHALGYSLDGSTLYSAGDDMTLRRWQLGDPKAEPIVIGEHNEQIPCLVVHPTTGEVLTGSRDDTIGWWDPESGKQVRRLDDHDDDVKSLAFSRSGRLLASASCDGTVRLRRGDNGQTLAVLAGHSDRVFCVDFGPEAKRLASGGVDGVIVWDLETRLPRYTYAAAEYASAVQFVRGGEWLLATDARGYIHVIDAASGQRIRRIPTARAYMAFAR